jgi:hypothetical protein
MTDETRNAVNRLANRLDERVDSVNDRLTENFDRILEHQDAIINELRLGKSERGKLIEDGALLQEQMRAFRHRLDMIETTQAQASIGATVIATAAAKQTAARVAEQAVGKEAAKKFWSTTAGKVTAWCAGIAGVGGALQVMPTVTGFVENVVVAIYKLLKGTGA